MLLVEGFVELAIRLWEGPFEPKILAWRRQSEPTLNFQPLLLGLCLERCKTEAHNPRLNEQPQLSVLAHKNLRPQKIVESQDVSMIDPWSNVVLVCKNIWEGNLCQSDKIYHQEKIKKNKAKNAKSPSKRTSPKSTPPGSPARAGQWRLSLHSLKTIK